MTETQFGLVLIFATLAVILATLRLTRPKNPIKPDPNRMDLDDL
jgi:hypothetical protein